MYSRKCRVGYGGLEYCLFQSTLDQIETVAQGERRCLGTETNERCGRGQASTTGFQQRKDWAAQRERPAGQLREEFRTRENGRTGLNSEAYSIFGYQSDAFHLTFETRFCPFHSHAGRFRTPFRGTVLS